MTKMFQGRDEPTPDTPPRKSKVRVYAEKGGSSREMDVTEKDPDRKLDYSHGFAVLGRLDVTTGKVK